MLSKWKIAGLLIGLAACSNTLADRYAGEVETTEQRIYRAAGIYSVVGGLACEYVQTPTALPGATARLGQAADAAYGALVKARAYAAFDDDATAGLAALSGLLTGLAAQVVEVSVDAPAAPGGGAAGVAAYAVERALQAAVGYAHLRASLAGLRGDLALMVADGRDPTENEWAAVMAAAVESRECLTDAAAVTVR